MALFLSREFHKKWRSYQLSYPKHLAPPSYATLRLKNSNSSGVSSGFSDKFQNGLEKFVAKPDRFQSSIKDYFVIDDAGHPDLSRFNLYDSSSLEFAKQRDNLIQWYEKYMSKPPIFFTNPNQFTPMKDVRTIIVSEIEGSLYHTFTGETTDSVILEKASELAGKHKCSVLIFKAVTKVSPKYEVSVETLAP